MNRLCSVCRAPVGRLDDTCPRCGVALPRQNPWYVYFIGAALVLLLFLWLGDLGGLIAFVEGLWRVFAGRP